MTGLRMRDRHELQCQEATQSYSWDRVMFPRPKLSPRLPLASLGNVHRPKMQAFYLLSKACSRAVSCWHLLWQLSLTTKGYTVNTTWQILKLACFHNCHFLRGERPFSSSLKTSGFQPDQHPRTSSHNHLLWKCHYSILKRLEQLCFFCNNCSFWKRKESNESQGRKSFHGSVMFAMCTRGKYSRKYSVVKPLVRDRIPLLLWLPDWAMSCCPPRKSASNSPHLMNHLIWGSKTIPPFQHSAPNSLSWTLFIRNLWWQETEICSEIKQTRR